MFHLVVTCVGSKNCGGPSIKDVTTNLLHKGIKNDAEILFQEWKKMLVLKMKADSLPKACDLYKQGMWKASIDAYNTIECEKSLWIISCGFGFINANDKICGYHATFKSGVEDSIYNTDYFAPIQKMNLVRNWWDYLTKNRIIETERPNSIHNLINESTRDDVVMIVAGEDYYNATYNDLCQIEISDDFPKLAFIGIKRLNGTYKPNIPEFLEPYIQSYSNRTELHKYLKKEYHKCNQNQINSMMAKNIIERYNKTGELEHTFP